MRSLPRRSIQNEQKENQIGVSLRSKTNPVDKIANELGGGGHKNAAGGKSFMTMDETIKHYEKCVKEYANEGNL